MTDSSSDEEDRLRLLQAVDKEFANDNLYKEGLAQCENTIPISLPSLRYSEADDIGQCNVNGLNVTPEFQKYVAKHLTSLIDQQLQEVDRSRKQIKRQCNDLEDCGVRLLLSSSKNISIRDPLDISKSHNSQRKRQLREVDMPSEEENLKISESAVSSEWILTGEAVKGWVTSTRGEVELGVLKKNTAVKPNPKKTKKKKTSNDRHVLPVPDNSK